MARSIGGILIALGTAAAAGCGGGSSGGSTRQGTTSGFTITIHDLAFSPDPLAVPPGATVTVVDMDAMPHTVTSETADGTLTKGSVAGVEFDTGSITGQTTFSIPANAQAGTVIPYYCAIHRGSMATPNGHLRIDPNAQPASGPSGPSGGGGY